MSRMKLVFAALIFAAMAVPMANAAYTPTTLWISGSSAMWQTMALGAYNSGNNYLATGTNPSPNAQTCHFTTDSSHNFKLTDTRNGQNIVDSGKAWVVWSVIHRGANSHQQDCTDSVTNNDPVEDIWVYESVDSVVGVRCYFAAPSCTIAAPNPIGGIGGGIGSTLWGDGTTDTVPSANVIAFLQAGAHQNVGATDIRPEDAAWAQCRVNSGLGNSAQSATGGTQDGLDGLGYNNPAANQNNAPGVCPHYTTSTAQDNINGIGLPIVTGIPGSSSQSNVVAFNITGNDPLTNTKIAAFTTYAVGAAPIVFVANNTNGTFTGATNATDRQLQSIFSGANCDAGALTGAAGGSINVFLREPLSGTYNTTEATVMRYPTAYGATGAGVIGTSMETGVTANPLTAAPCTAGGKRWRAIGTGQEVSSVLHSADAVTFPAPERRDGIGFAFFSYGNVSSLADNSNYKYLQLNGVDPIFASYGQRIDPGQPATPGTIPGVADVTGGFPACENKIWKGGLSFPNVRNGSYRAWSSLRFVSTGSAGAAVAKLVTNSNKYVVTTVPDYVPAVKVTIPATANPCEPSGTYVDPGLGFLRSHYQQKDGAGTNLGAAPVNTGADKGGDMGGAIIPLQLGVVTTVASERLGDKQTQLVQGSDANTGLGPYSRP